MHFSLLHHSLCLEFTLSSNGFVNCQVLFFPQLSRRCFYNDQTQKYKLQWQVHMPGSREIFLREKLSHIIWVCLNSDTVVSQNCSTMEWCMYDCHLIIASEKWQGRGWTEPETEKFSCQHLKTEFRHLNLESRILLSVLLFSDTRSWCIENIRFRKENPGNSAKTMVPAQPLWQGLSINSKSIWLSQKCSLSSRYLAQWAKIKPWRLLFFSTQPSSFIMA